MLTEEIKAAQAAYAARPFAVRWEDSHFAGTSRFDTLDEAFEYIQAQWLRIQKAAQTASYYTGSSLRRSYLETPTGRVQLSYVLLCRDVNSYGVS